MKNVHTKTSFLIPRAPAFALACSFPFLHALVLSSSHAKAAAIQCNVKHATLRRANPAYNLLFERKHLFGRVCYWFVSSFVPRPYRIPVFRGIYPNSNVDCRSSSNIGDNGILSMGTLKFYRTMMWLQQHLLHFPRYSLLDFDDRHAI